MIGTEQEALVHAITQCAIRGSGWVITDSRGEVMWNIERDTKVDDDDLTFPVIVHLRGPMASDAIAIVTEVESA